MHYSRVSDQCRIDEDFTIGFDSAGFDEVYHAAAVARHLDRLHLDRIAPTDSAGASCF
jgi:hypothetical protein